MSASTFVNLNRSAFAQEKVLWRKVEQPGAPTVRRWLVSPATSNFRPNACCAAIVTGSGYAELYVLFVSVFVRVMFGSFFRVVLGLQVVAMGRMSVMRAFLVIACLVMFGGSAVVLRSMFMVLCGFVMMINVCIRHGNNPF